MRAVAVLLFTIGVFGAVGPSEAGRADGPARGPFALRVTFPASITFGHPVWVSAKGVKRAGITRLVLQQSTGSGWKTRSVALVGRSPSIVLSFALHTWKASLLLRVEAIRSHRVVWRSRPGQVAVDPHTIFYRNPSLDHADASDVFSDPLSCGCIPLPFDKTICWIYGVGTIDQPISSFNVGDFTGLNPPAPLGQYQYGHDNGRYGSSACQLDGTWAGALLDKNDGPQAATLYGWGLEYFWSGFVYKPWSARYVSASLPDGPYFRLQTNWSLGRSDLGTSIQYSQICAEFYDAGSGRSMFWCPEAWDSRSSDPPGEFVQFNGFSNGADIVDTYYAAGTRFATLQCQSQTRGQTNGNALQPDWYAVYLPWSQFHALTMEINRDFGANYSSDPENYYLRGVNTGSEMYAPPGTNGSFGSRVGNLIAMDDADPCAG